MRRIDWMLGLVLTLGAAGGAAAAPIAEYLIPESSGATTANTGSEGPATGALGAGVSFAASEPANGAYGTGHSLSFTGGAGATVSAGAFPSLQTNYNALTLMAWVNIPDMDGVTLRHVIHASGTSSGLPTGFALAVNSTRAISLAFRQDDGTVLSPTSDNNAVALNEWVHMAVTADFAGGVLKYFVNGVQFGSTDALATNRAITGDASTVVALGRLTGLDASMMKGGLDDARIFTEVLSEQQIAGYMTAAIPEPGTMAALLGVWLASAGRRRGK